MPSFLAPLLELIYPTHCIFCGALGRTLCVTCGSGWSLTPRLIRSDPIPMWSALTYSPRTSRLILSAKEDNNRMARELLASSVVKTFEHCVTNLHPQKIILIPIPSSKSMNRKRGYLHSLKLCYEIKRQSKLLCDVQNLLIHNRKVRDQSELSFSQRAVNMEGSYSLNGHYDQINQSGEGALIIVIDDLITSGSSVREAVRALKSGLISPDLAISACAVGGAYRLR